MKPSHYTELDDLYELSNAPVEKRLKLFQEQNEVVKQADDAFIRQIAVLTLAGLPDKACRVFKGYGIAYREGSSRVRRPLLMPN